MTKKEQEELREIATVLMDYEMNILLAKNIIKGFKNIQDENTKLLALEDVYNKLDHIEKVYWNIQKKLKNIYEKEKK